MQLASRNPLFRTGCCWLGNLFCKACWATPFKMRFDFRPLLHRTFAKIPLSANHGHQEGVHQRKSKHQAPWCLALAKLHFWELGCFIWSLFLETSESNAKKYQHQVQGLHHGIWLWRSLTFRSSAATYEGKGKYAVPSPAGPPGGRRAAGDGSP